MTHSLLLGRRRVPSSELFDGIDQWRLIERSHLRKKSACDQGEGRDRCPSVAYNRSKQFPCNLDPAAMETLVQHLRTAVRSLIRARGFSAAAIATLAFNIGLTTAVFTIADALLLRKLPVRDQDRVVVVAGISKDGRTTNYPLSVQDAQEFARASRALSGAAFISYEGATPKPMHSGDVITPLRRALVSGNYFALLGTNPIMGRALRAEDDVVGAAPVMVLSHRAWRERFNAAPNIVGHRVDLYDDGASYTIVGVMPQGLDFPRGVDAWSAMFATIPAQNIPFVSLNVLGRLASGSTVETAASEMTRFWHREGAPPFQRDMRGGATPLAKLVIGNTKPAVLAFAAAAILLLLITCVNVANLLLVRGLRRTREMAVRIALGASHGRVMAPVLAETAVLAVTGGVLAIAVGAIVVQLFVNFAPASLPRVDEVSLNGAALLVTVATTMFAMLLFTLVPAWFVTRVRGVDTLRSGARQTMTRLSRLTSEGLVVAQVALALLVLSASLLVGRSFTNLQRAELSFDAAPLVVAELSLRADRYRTAAAQLAMLHTLLQSVQEIPGVTGVTPIVAVPFSAVGWDATLSAEGQTADALSTNPLLNMELASPDYFRTMGLRILHGRAFDGSDRAGAPPVAILSESAARQYWPGQSAVGKRLFMGSIAARRTFSVVGVVPDTRYRDLRLPRASIYFPLWQSFFPFAPTTLVIRTTTSAAAIASALRKVVHDHAPGVVVARVTPFASFLDAPLAQPRLNAMLLAVFASASVVLASIGLFGVMATMVQQRTREFGVRQALGATPYGVGCMVLRRGVTLAVIGSAVGLVAALAVNRLLRAVLFDVSPTNAGSLALTALLLLAVATLASAIPARQSTRVAPLEAMRAE